MLLSLVHVQKLESFLSGCITHERLHNLRSFLPESFDGLKRSTDIVVGIDFLHGGWLLGFIIPADAGTKLELLSPQTVGLW